MAKIATIKNFSNMEESGVYYLEGMVARKINGQSILTPGYLNSFVLSEDTTGFSNLGTIRNGISFKHIIAESGNGLMIDSGGYIYGFDIVSATHMGAIHNVVTSATPDPDSSPISFCDIAVTKNENILYSGRDALGIGYRGIVETGSDATKIIDEDGRNWTTLGISTTAGSNKVWNFTKEEEYTVTSISTTNSTNDTLNFAAGGTANADGDIFMVFSDIGSLNGSAYFDFFATTAYPHFKGQEAKTNFKRQIEFFNKRQGYIIGNGNYLAELNIDETTWDDNLKQLPDNAQFECMSVNQDRILIGASIRGKGVLLLWDGYADGWLAIEELEQIPTCIKPYSSGWLVTIGSAVYFSNGQQSNIISRFPDMDDLDGQMNTFYNSMAIVNDRVILNTNSGKTHRAKTGTWIYEFGSGWSIIPFDDDNGNPLYDSGAGAVFSVADYPDNPRTRNVFTSFGNSKGTHENCLNRLLDRIANKYSVIFYITLPKKINISQIILNISPQYDLTTAYGTVSASLAIGDGKNQFWRLASSAASSTTTLIKNGSGATDYQSGIVGHQVRMLVGNSSGDRSYITSIASPGTASEALTISPALSSAPLNGERFNLIPLKLADTHTFDGEEIPDEIPFTVEGFYGDKLYFEVYFNTTSATKIDIHNIDIYGE